MSDTDIIIAAIQALGYVEQRSLSSYVGKILIVAFEPGPRLSPLAPTLSLHCNYSGVDTLYHLSEQDGTVYHYVDSLQIFQQLIAFKKKHRL